MSRSRFAFVAILLLVVGSCAVAASLTVNSYSMINGLTGGRGYEDFSYTNCPGPDHGCLKDYYDSLSGGTGKLTDTISPAQNFSAYPSKNPYVGWYAGNTKGLNPIVTFYFASPVLLDSVTAWLDNAHAGAVTLPKEVSVGVNGVWYNLLIPRDSSNLAPRAEPIEIPHVLTSSVEVQFDQYNSQSWVMVGEVSFAGKVVTPEPATWLLISGGLIMAGLLRRKRVN